MINIPEHVLAAEREAREQTRDDPGILAVGISHNGGRWDILIIHTPKPYAAVPDTEIGGVPVRHVSTTVLPDNQ